MARKTDSKITAQQLSEQRRKDQQRLARSHARARAARKREARRSSVSVEPREQLREQLAAHRKRERGARILDEQRAEREAQRAARSEYEQLLAKRSLSERVSGQRPDVEQLTAERRSAYREALSYPMTALEVLDACAEALARYPDDADRAEALSALVEYVIGRHGREPLRCDVGRDWLAKLGERFYARERERTEHKTGMRQAAAQLRAWHDDDEQEARERDPVAYRAQNIPAPTDSEPLDAEQLIERLALTAKQSEALRRTLDAEKRSTLALTGAERVAANKARAALRRRFPDALTLRCAMRPDDALSMLASEALDAAISTARASAAAAARGSHLAGSVSGASSESSRAALRRYGPQRLADSLTAPLPDSEQRAALRRAVRKTAQQHRAMLDSWQALRSGPCCGECR